MGNLNNIQRRLAEGIASWLLFEFHCQRGDLFSEKYLSSPVGQILQGRFGNRVQAEVDHPILADSGQVGRRPQVDFAVKDEANNLKIFIETKWAGKSTFTLEQLLWDLIRLELIAFHRKVDCYFVLAGFEKKLNPLLEEIQFRPTGNQDGLSTRLQTKFAIRIDRAPEDVVTNLKARMVKYPKVKYPNILNCDFPHSYPQTGNNMTFSVYVWRVWPNKKSQRKLAN